MNLLIRSFATMLGLALVLTLASCSQATNKESSARDSLPSLSLGAMSSMDYLPYIIAQEQGYCDSLGLDLKIVKFFSANDRESAFQADQIDGTVTDFTGAVLQKSASKDLAFIMKHDGYFELLCSKESNIQDLASIKNHSLAYSANTVIDYAGDKMLEAAGLMHDDVKKVEINKIPIRLEMLRNNQVDASIFPDPFITIAKSEGLKSLANTIDLGITVTGTVFSRRALQEKEASIRKLIEAYNWGVDFMEKNDRQIWQSSIAEHVGLPAHLLGSLVLPKYTKAALPSMQDLESSIEWLRAKGLLQKEVSPEEMVIDFISK